MLCLVFLQQKRLPHLAVLISLFLGNLMREQSKYSKCIVLILIGLSAFPVLAYAFPESIRLWKQQAVFFKSLDFNNEDAFKSQLIAYYRRIYTDAQFCTIEKWINTGNLESEHFSTFFNDFEDTKVVSFTKISDITYRLNTEQNSCYSLDYNPPIIESIVAQYKVINYSQTDVDQWYEDLALNQDAKLCLRTLRTVQFEINAQGLINSEQQQIDESHLDLASN